MTSYKSTKVIGIEQLTEFFTAVDRNLERSAKITVIGGSAAAFHGATSLTNDVDTFGERIAPDLERAIEQARIETGFSIPVGSTGVAQIPENSEDRLVRCLPELERLEVFILEQHDLAISKTLRGNEHDEQQIQEIHNAHALDFEILVTRFRDEILPIYIGDQTSIRLQFLNLIARIFGALKRARAEKLLR